MTGYIRIRGCVEKMIKWLHLKCKCNWVYHKNAKVTIAKSLIGCIKGITKVAVSNGINGCIKKSNKDV